MEIKVSLDHLEGTIEKNSGEILLQLKHGSKQEK
tara:strand:- start:422 stop:523 length:102 start_codon:yes stop_codon:yes gene_type:complete